MGARKTMCLRHNDSDRSTCRTFSFWYWCGLGIAFAYAPPLILHVAQSTQTVAGVQESSVVVDVFVCFLDVVNVVVVSALYESGSTTRLASSISSDIIRSSSGTDDLAATATLTP